MHCAPLCQRLAEGWGAAQILQLSQDTVKRGLTLMSSGNHALACVHACDQLAELRCGQRRRRAGSSVTGQADAAACAEVPIGSRTPGSTCRGCVSR